MAPKVLENLGEHVLSFMYRSLSLLLRITWEIHIDIKKSNETSDRLLANKMQYIHKKKKADVSRTEFLFQYSSLKKEKKFDDS